MDTALEALLADQDFDLVVSGTNKGENIGTSENISGTVNGAMAGLQHGLPAIAVSAAADEAGDEGFANAAAYTVDLLQRLEDQQQAGQPLLPEGTGLSVNVPKGGINGAVLTEITRKSSSEYPITENDDGTYGSSAIDQQGSERLLGKGDMLYKPNTGAMVRVHCLFVSDEEVEAVADHWRWTGLPTFWCGVARWSVVAGMYALWAGLTLSAATGADLPIAGEGYAAGLVAQGTVSMLILGCSLAMTVGWSLFVIGLMRGRDAGR